MGRKWDKAFDQFPLNPFKIGRTAAVRPAPDVPQAVHEQDRTIGDVPDPRHFREENPERPAYFPVGVAVQVIRQVQLFPQRLQRKHVFHAEPDDAAVLFRKLAVLIAEPGQSLFAVSVKANGNETSTRPFASRSSSPQETRTPSVDGSAYLYKA
jgi:hypothetical protein